MPAGTARAVTPRSAGVPAAARGRVRPRVIPFAAGPPALGAAAVRTAACPRRRGPAVGPGGAADAPLGPRPVGAFAAAGVLHGVYPGTVNGTSGALAGML